MNDFNTTDSSEDADATALDEGRLALAQLLAAAEPRFDEQKLVGQICGRLACRQTRGRRLLAGLAIAAVLLLGVGPTWWLRAVRRTTIAAVPEEMSIDFGWHDELEEEIAATCLDIWLVEAEARRQVEPAEWVAQDLDQLQWELDVGRL